MNYQTVIEKFSQQKVLVIGELMLDVYLNGTSRRICREAPVPVVNVEKRTDVPGAAANTAINLAALGAQTTFLTITGRDSDSETVLALLKDVGVDTACILRDPSRQTITKKRVVAEGQLLLRYDAGSVEAAADDFERQLIRHLETLYPLMDAILISDYGYGVVTDKVIEMLKALQEQQPKLLVIDSKNLERFRDLQPSVVKPNYQEAAQLLNFDKQPEGERADQVLTYEQDILDITGARVVALTMDTEGAVIFERGEAPYRTFAKAVPGSKTAGAGDTYVSVLALAFSLGLSTPEAANLATVAAHVVVNKEGTACCSAYELMSAFKPAKVIGNLDDLRLQVEEYRQQEQRIVFTNGCFDILHVGHITYLAQAKERGDILIVGVNSDQSVRQLKGKGRPINTLEDRMRVLAALDCVDHVIAFNESTPIELIKVIQPDCYVKGGDYSKASLPEAPIVEALGGKVEILPYVMERSTTAVIRKIRTFG
jgi:D-beta-D-heptose 7-phosphate kinase / D-beta-D-heptose 1-phosphate adenosyltransferase